MENGAGIVEDVNVVDVRTVDGELPELKVEDKVVGDGVHMHKESDGDDVFEEAVESVLDDGISDQVDGLKPGVEDVAITIGANDDDDEEIGLEFSLAEGSSSLVDEGEMARNAVEGCGEGRDGDIGSVEVNDDLLATNEDEVLINHVSGNEVVAIDGVTSDDERIVHQDASVATVSGSVGAEITHGEGIEGEVSRFEEAKDVDGDEGLVEKSVVVETSVSRDFGDTAADDASARDVEVVDANGDVNHVKEMVSESEDASARNTSQNQLKEIEEIKEAVVADVEDHGGTVVEPVSGSTSSDLQENVGAGLQDMGEAKSDSEGTHVKSEGDQATAVPQHHNAEGSIPSSSEMESPASILSSENKEVKNESVADLGAQNGTIGKLTQVERQNSEVTARPAPYSFGKSANPSLPPAPAGLGRAAPLLEPASKVVQQPRANGQASRVQTQLVEDSTNGDVEEGDEIREKLQMIRVKFLRLAYRLGQTPHNVVVAQVLYRLGLAEQLRARNGGRVGSFSFDRASALAKQLEASGQEPLDISCTIMVLGKTGVGKSATINSIFNEVKFSTDAFQVGTKKVQEIVGLVEGVKVRVIDTPGLHTSCSDQRQNEKILRSVKRLISKSPPDIVLYLDRLDMPSRDFGDMPLLRTISDIFGPSIWFNAIVVLTHAASAPPDGPNGAPSTYDFFVTQRSHAVQQAIRQAAGDMRLMNPVSLVENHSACRTNRDGQRVLPNGQVWKPHLLLLSFASKILAEANILLKLQDSPPGKTFAPRSRAPPLPFLLSSLLQSRAPLKLPEEQYADDDSMDDDLDVSSESDEESEYDELPPFKPLTKAQLSKLTKAQRKAYYDELEYREKLFMKRQLREERRRRKMMKKMAAVADDMVTDYSENVEAESSGAASLPVPMPDLSLPASFDSDNPTHRYRYLDTSNQWLVRPVLDNHGWDHDVGYEGINVERMFVVKDKIPLSFSGQVSKDKKEANVQMEVASSIKHGKGKGTTMGFDLQSVGKDLAYTLRSETRLNNYRWNKMTAGLSATLLGDSLSAGVKLEDKLILNKQFRVVTSGGAMACRGDIAYGGSLEANLRDKDYPLGRFLSTLGLSVMDWHGELALGCNIQSQIPVGRSTNMVARVNVNNRGSGQVSLRLNSSEQLQLALISLLPLIRKLMQRQDINAYGY